ILGDEDASVASIDLTNNPITTDMVIGLLDVGTIDDPVNGSRVVTRMISESMISNISDIIPDEAYETEKDIKRSELYGLSEALVILDIEDVTGDDVTADEMTIAQLRDLIDIDSVIIHKMIS